MRLVHGIGRYDEVRHLNKYWERKNITILYYLNKSIDSVTTVSKSKLSLTD